MNPKQLFHRAAVRKHENEQQEATTWGTLVAQFCDGKLDDVTEDDVLDRLEKLGQTPQSLAEAADALRERRELQATIAEEKQVRQQLVQVQAEHQKASQDFDKARHLWRKRDAELSDSITALQHKINGIEHARGKLLDSAPAWALDKREKLQADTRQLNKRRGFLMQLLDVNKTKFVVREGAQDVTKLTIHEQLAGLEHQLRKLNRATANPNTREREFTPLEEKLTATKAKRTACEAELEAIEEQLATNAQALDALAKQAATA